MYKLSLINGGHWFSIALSAALFSLAAVGCGRRPLSAEVNSTSLEMLDGRTVPVEEVEAAIVRIMEQGAFVFRVDPEGQVTGMTIEIREMALPLAEKIE